jgi:hypothetical protein
MQKVKHVCPMGSESDSASHSDSTSSVPEQAPKRQSVHGKHKQPSKPSHSCSPVLEVNVVDFTDTANKSTPGLSQSHTQSQSGSHGEGPSSVPYLAKGKYRAFFEDDEPTNKDRNNAQIESDYLIAKELEKRLDDEYLKTRKLEKRNKQMANELQTLKDKTKVASDAPRGTTQLTSGSQKSKTPIGQVSSRLPTKSGLLHAMQGYNGGCDNPPFSSSSSSDSNHSHKRNKKGPIPSDSSSESS